MKKFTLFLLIGLLIIIVFPVQQNTLFDHIATPVHTKIDSIVEGKTNPTELKTPENQMFSIRNVQMNMSKDQVESNLGKPEDTIGNEYGTDWYIYHNQFHDYVMIAYVDGKVHGLYTNQNIITSKEGIKYNSPKDFVREKLGKPIEQIKKGNTIYRQKSDEYDVFDIDRIYTTVFYDKHENNQLTGILQVSHTLENRLNARYAAPSDYLQKSYELEDFYLVNAARVQKGLKPLKHSDELTNTARKHSTDMAKNHYFDHNNPQGQTPFDRLKEEGINYNVAAENLAYGQVSGVFAHHGLMNSIGHRKNILNKNVNRLGVGVDFNSEQQPYWTENYTN
ncbi:CAP domain-containing protein [Staphylococcus felis]|nr:CAP domain-containing protein [Staphylococcus felis]